jgi:aminoglycoside phosphotransferase family enzyme
LDYSTLEKRKAACRAELEVNRRFAPQLYHRIVPITRESNGELALDGRGEAIEWTVEMTRFDENQTLDHIADRGEFDERMAAKLADIVLAMHDRAEAVEAMPWLSTIERIIDQNTEALLQHDNLFPMQSVIELNRKTRAAFNRLLPLLTTRGKQGLIRGHGDLHLGNIAMLDGKPIAFDAIEFDPMIASGDVLYDLAFLLIDAIERSLYWPANVILNGYFAAGHMEDYDGLAALPLFMSLRAAIRAKVIAARLDQSVRKERLLPQSDPAKLTSGHRVIR